MVKSDKRDRKPNSDKSLTRAIRDWIEKYPASPDQTVAEVFGVCRTTVRHHRAMLAREAEKRRRAASDPTAPAYY